jgi:hypothetical protein
VRAAKLALLLNLLERKLMALAEADVPAADTRLAVVPAPDEPELPIPSPAAKQTPALTLARERAPPPAQNAVTPGAAPAIIPEVTWLDGPPPGSFSLEDADRHDDPPPSMGEKVAALASEPDAQPPLAAMPAPMPGAPPVTTPLPPPANPLAGLTLLTEVERLALFT